MNEIEETASAAVRSAGGGHASIPVRLKVSLPSPVLASPRMIFAIPPTPLGSLFGSGLRSSQVCWNIAHNPPLGDPIAFRIPLAFLRGVRESSAMTEKPFDVFGVGNALVDIQAQISDSLLTKLNVNKGIMTLVDDQQQGELLSHLDGASLHRCAGGSAANTIVAMADLGGSAAFVGKVGQDEVGTFFVDEMRKLGITIDVDPADAPTGTSAILITEDAQRTMLTNLGASATLMASDIEESFVQRAKYVYIEGYLLTGESTKAAAYQAMELAQKHGTKIAFTASHPFL